MEAMAICVSSPLSERQNPTPNSTPRSRVKRQTHTHPNPKGEKDSISEKMPTGQVMSPLVVMSDVGSTTSTSTQCLKHTTCPPGAKEPRLTVTGHQAHPNEAQSTKRSTELLRAIPNPGDARGPNSLVLPRRMAPKVIGPRQALKQKEDKDRKGKQDVGTDRQAVAGVPTGVSRRP